ncbi:60S ribosomal protein L31-like [Pteronotus mesoamericanus]|uniref:60S ribosomal protein L31-like n=1 Tax=Pteronotus mesoamericanus TaxID=1884717 RepID=UPI0023ECF744|nr:60S ribosomal protein L31-like [Pteronotus parnellii mesoamericanus]
MIESLLKVIHVLEGLYREPENVECVWATVNKDGQPTVTPLPKDSPECCPVSLHAAIPEVTTQKRGSILTSWWHISSLGRGALSFQLGPGILAPAKKCGKKKKGRSAINEAVTTEYTINIHKRIHGVGFKMCAPRALREIQKFAMKEMGILDARVDTKLKKAVWAKRIRNVPYWMEVQLSRKRNEDKESPNKLYTMVTQVPVPTFKNLQTVNVEEN